eukprot:1677716-Pyramimonas_sp.AAC.1
MARLGWTMRGGPALPAEKRARSRRRVLSSSVASGQMLLDGPRREKMHTCERCQDPGRAARCYIRSAELGAIMVGTVYAFVGEGLTPRNLNLMRCLGTAVLAHKTPFVHTRRHIPRGRSDGERCWQKETVIHHEVHEAWAQDTSGYHQYGANSSRWW